MKFNSNAAAMILVALVGLSEATNTAIVHGKKCKLHRPADPLAALQFHSSASKEISTGPAAVDSAAVDPASKSTSSISVAPVEHAPPSRQEELVAQAPAQDSTQKAPQSQTPTISSTSAAASSPSASPSSSPASSPDVSPTTPGGVSGKAGATTRYWDCCKPSCSWEGKAPVTKPVNTCAKDGVTRLTDLMAKNGCEAGGEAFACNDNQPFAVSDDLAYGFAAAHITGRTEKEQCCACFKLKFTSQKAKDKTMIVQITNTGADLKTDQFDIQMPGGGVGIFNGCQAQWDSPADGWGQRYGGLQQASDCDSLPKELQPGCKWRYTWFADSDNPTVEYEETECPAKLTDISGCKRT